MNFAGFTNSIGDYIHRSSWLPTVLLPVLGLLFCYVIGIALNRSVVKRTDDDDVLKHEFYKHRARVYAGFGVMVVTIWLILYCCARGIYQAETGPLRQAELGSLLLLLACGGFSAYWLWQLRSYYTPQRISFIVTQANTAQQGKELTEKAKSEFDRTKRWVLFLLLGLIGLGFYVWSPRTLVSLVIDDSGSMGENLKTGKDALAEVMPRLNRKRTHVMLTSFGKSRPDSTQPFASFAALARTTDADSLDAQYSFHEDPLEVSEQVGTLKPDKLLGLNVAIWKNYLKSREQSEAVQYDNRVMLIVSDGEEFSSNWYTTTFCEPQPDFSDFYGGKVYFIDLLPIGSAPYPGTQGFREVIKGCFGEDNIRNGNDINNYLEALTDVFQPFRFDIYLPAMVALFCVIYIIIMLLVQVPAKLTSVYETV